MHGRRVHPLQRAYQAVLGMQQVQPVSLVDVGLGHRVESRHGLQGHERSGDGSGLSDYRKPGGPCEC